jgi:hypothetical protein
LFSPDKFLVISIIVPPTRALRAYTSVHPAVKSSLAQAISVAKILIFAFIRSNVGHKFVPFSLWRLAAVCAIFLEAACGVSENRKKRAPQLIGCHDRRAKESEPE